MHLTMEEKIRELFGWTATVLTMCFYISPIIPFIHLFRGKINYEDTPAIVVTSSYVNCFCWFIYGQLIYSDQIKICNLIGAISSFALVCIYLLYEIKKYTLDAILNFIIIVSGSYAIYRGFTIVIEDDSIIGKICIATSCIVFLSPIQILFRVMREKNYNLIPIYSAFISSIATSCWVVYGIFMTDINVIFPNFIGIILALLQIIIFTRYKKKYTTIDEKEPTSTIGIESNENDNEKNKKEDITIKDEEEKQSNIKAKPVKIVSKIDN